MACYAHCPMAYAMDAPVTPGAIHDFTNTNFLTYYISPADAESSTQWCFLGELFPLRLCRVSLSVESRS
jgi:hypothetical protein